MNDTVHFEKTLSSETLFEGRVITLTKDTALLENGKTATREVVHHHGGACILPYFADGTICIVRQFRYAMHSGFLPDGRPFGQAASILLNIGGVKIYDLGDTALQQDFKLVGEIYKPDIAFIPIGGRANMNINEALVAARWLGAGIVVPIHYDLYTEGSVDPFEFKSKLESTTNIQCMVMRP